MKKRQSNYFVIIIFSLALILTLLGKNHIYGSQIDWINQHTVIPNLLRSLFYQTGKLIPNFIFNLGAGQNIFNYSYYGLMNPYILISYFLPFIKMETFISISSIIIYLISGILLFEFLYQKKISNKFSLYATIAFQCLAPITFQFHHHIMFVWYFPFLIMALFGVERYLNNKGSCLLIVSIFLIIITNYYYSIPCLLTIMIYGCYRIIQKGNHTIKDFIISCLRAAPRVIIPIILSSFILIPTAFCMFKMDRSSNLLITIKDLLIPHIEEVAYSSFGIGLSFILLLAPFGNLCTKNKKAEDIFLSLSLIVLTLCPIFMYLLNGRLYIRGKVLIPISILYILSLVKFISNLEKEEISMNKLYFITATLAIILVTFNTQSPYAIIFSIDVIFSLLSIIIFKRTKKSSLIFKTLILTLFISSICNNYTEIYLPIENNEDVKTVKKLLSKIEDNTLYRTDNIIDSNKNANRVYNRNYYSTTIYSSTYNPHYQDFYTSKIGNNIEHRNKLNTSGANNYLFNKLMGVKYIISNHKYNDNYEKIASKNSTYLYKNNHANPLVYTTNNYGSSKEYRSLSFPYNIEYLINYPTTEDRISPNHNSTISKIDIGQKNTYKLDLKKDKKITYELPNPIKDKILIISFDMKYNQLCKEGDTSIRINGVKNKLTCKEWLYHNKNNNFKYVITNKKEFTNLKIKLSKGKYIIDNINIYTMDYPKDNYKELSNLKINKQKSEIVGTINEKESSYLITSFPYDEGFTAYIDNTKVEKEIVNTAFLGFKVPKGKHNIKIKYSSPGYKAGKIISVFGLILMIILLSLETKNRKNTNRKINSKECNKEK